MLIVAGVGYLGYVWAPIYYDHITVKQTVTDFMNQAVKNRDDAALRDAMVKKLARIQMEEGFDGYGQPVRVPAIQVDDRALTWDRDVPARSLHVAFDYDRQVVYPFLNRTVVKTFTIDLTTDLTVPDWGLSR
jgi:hypothetical protein